MKKTSVFSYSQLSVNEYCAGVQCKLVDSHMRPMRSKPTMLSLPRSTANLLAKAATELGTSMKEIILCALTRELMDSLKLADRANVSGVVKAYITKLLRNRSHSRPRCFACRSVPTYCERYYYYPIRIPLGLHRQLKILAVKYDTSMSRIVTTAVDMVAPYIIEHSK